MMNENEMNVTHTWHDVTIEIEVNSATVEIALRKTTLRFTLSHTEADTLRRLLDTETSNPTPQADNEGRE